MPASRPSEGKRYRHYKGNVYRVLCLAKHSENEEVLVVYQSESDPTSIWARPIDMFREEVVVEGKTLPRFTELV